MTSGQGDDRVPPTRTGDVAGAPPTPPPGQPGVVYGYAPRPPQPPIGEQTLYMLLAVAGGVLLLGFLLAAVGVNPGFAATVSFLGIVGLIVVLIVGAAGATEVSREGRIAMGVLAGFLVLAALWSFTFMTSATYATCGAIAAAPAIFALRAFTFLRDGWLASHADPQAG